MLSLSLQYSFKRVTVLNTVILIITIITYIVTNDVSTTLLPAKPLPLLLLLLLPLPLPLPLPVEVRKTKPCCAAGPALEQEQEQELEHTQHLQQHPMLLGRSAELSLYRRHATSTMQNCPHCNGMSRTSVLRTTALHDKSFTDGQSGSSHENTRVKQQRITVGGKAQP